jgi:Putative zinc-finger
MSEQCQHFDAFAADELSPNDAERFESHLDQCDACREAIDQQGWIENLLRSPTRLELEPVSPALSESFRKSILSRRRARRTACGLAAAAGLVIAAGWTAVLNRQAWFPAGQEMAGARIGGEEPSRNPSLKGSGIAEPPRSTFVGGPDLLVVPVASRHPNVTIVRLYPTYQPEFSSASESRHLERRELDDSNWTDSFNGG